VGTGVGDAELPGNVRVVRGIPLHDLLPTCELALAALAHGLPQLVLPQMCVHFEHGDRVAALGAGLCLHPGEATEATIQDATVGLLGNDGARAVAEALRRENDEQLSPSAVVEHLQGVMA
jgi:UDP:flavonoid glycosyltransferase YjiC (YdhE family)